jgi:hypothetical protein
VVIGFSIVARKKSIIMRVMPVLEYHIIRLAVKFLLPGGGGGAHFQVIGSSEGSRGYHPIHGTAPSCAF